MAQETIRLKAIEAVSPTLVETLRMCKLRAGLSRVTGVGQYLLGNPKAWLGTAYHAVLEAVDTGDENDIDSRVRDLWSATIERQYKGSRAHPLNKRFGPPESWPGYHMVSAMVVVRAREMVESATRQSRPSRSGYPDSINWRERKFCGANGRIVGRPDVVRPGEVVDFKTGDVFEDDAQEKVRAAYMRQLRLYSYLVKETFGWWPQRGVLRPMAGSPVAVELEADECEAEAKEAIRLLDEYNNGLANSLEPVDLASPSPTSCRWCAYQLYCPAFWNAVTPDWKGNLGSVAVAGSVTGPARPIHGGSALSISLQVARGIVPSGKSISLFPLDPSVHTDVPLVKDGDQLRIVGLWRRANDSLIATKQTMIALEAMLPQIEIGA